MTGRGDEIARTIAVPACEPRHPALASWPDYNLIVGSCPRCGHQVPPDYPWRVLRARQIAKERFS